eukprot:11008-Pyramimonas_sp.AAC.1
MPAARAASGIWSGVTSAFAVRPTEYDHVTGAMVKLLQSSMSGPQRIWSVPRGRGGWPAAERT